MHYAKLYKGLPAFPVHSPDPRAVTEPRTSVQRTAATPSCQDPFTSRWLTRWIDALDCCPWGTTSGRAPETGSHRPDPAPLYTPEERRRRDESAWTVVQGVLAPFQFLVFLISLGFVLRYLATGDGYAAATDSIIVKTLVLYAIMVTGSIWERAVFGRYLFAPAFYWEDMFSILVLVLHTAYLAALLSGVVDPRQQMLIALAAYASYAVNAAQFVCKLRAARREAGPGMMTQPGRAA